MEDNKLIASYICMQKTDLGWFDNEAVLNIKGSNTFDELLFDTSWDWLIPVVEKIESLDFIFTISKSGIWVKPDTFNILSNYDRKTYTTFTENLSKIQLVYKAVVDFIEWYNKQEDG